MKPKIVLSLIFAAAALTSQAQIVKSYDRPTAKEFKAAVKTVLQETSCLDADPKQRLDALNIVQREINNFSTDDWAAFGKSFDWIALDDKERNGTLYFYRQSFNKVCREVKSTKVAAGTVVIWNVYNMGYVVKTPSHTFGIDVTHKHIEELSKLLEFVLITHKHGDHNDGHQNNQYAVGGTKIIAGFNLAKPCVWQGKLLDWEYVEDGETVKIDDITITCHRVDHNKADWGKKFVTTYRIDCGTDTDHTVIFHTGDACNYEQLEAAAPVDFFIFHMAVGLDRQKAIDKIRPNYAIFSHAWELGHSVVKWRWTIDDLIDRSKDITGIEPSHKLLPAWGEKIVYNKKTGTATK